MDLRRDGLTEKFYQWIGQAAADTQVFNRYYIRNFDDPEAWDVSQLFVHGRPLRHRPTLNGCAFTRIPINPFA